MKVKNPTLAQDARMGHPGHPHRKQLANQTVKLTVKLYGENSTLKVFGCRTLH